MLLAGVGGWCSHVSGITLGTGCVPKDDPLGDPSLLGNVPLAVWLKPSCHNTIGYFYMFCVLLAGVGGDASTCLELF